MNNKISHLQNTELFLKYLAASSQVYAKAKLFVGLQFTLTIPAALAWSIAAAYKPELNVWLVFYSFTVSIVEAWILERYQSELRKLGAKIQEKFDCELFQFPWKQLKLDRQPEVEFVHAEAQTYFRKHSDLSYIKNWYPKIPSSISLPLARLICHRSSCKWDSTLRRQYSSLLSVILAFLVIAVFAIALYSGMTMESFVMTVVAPLTPAIIWSVREITKHKDAGKAVERLKTFIDDTWTSVLNGTLNGNLELITINIQDEIFDNRSKNPFIFNWIYRLMRTRSEQDMLIKAQDMVAEALNRNPA